MKKLIGILCIAVFSTTMVFNTHQNNDFSDINLTALMVANAQDGEYENGDGASGFFGEAVMHSICETVTIGGGKIPASYSYEDCYDEWQCDGWNGWCY